MKINEIEQILFTEIKSNKSPSVQYYFFDKERIIKEFHFGFADFDKQIKANGLTTYHAFSITKTFTALGILQLAEDKKLDIDQPVIKYLPEFPYGFNITIRQVLNHTSGIPNPLPLNWIHLASEHKSFSRDEFFKLVISKNNKVKSEPNEKYSYSNLGYVILGSIIEKVSGKSYEQFIIDNIIAKLPIDANDLTFEITDYTKHATGYHKKFSFSYLILGFFIDKSKYFNKTENKWKSFNHFYVNGPSYGGLIGKPIAFVKYIQELLKDNDLLISNENKKLLFTENKNNSGKNTGMCLSWFTGELNGVKYFTHAGGGGGYYCEIRIYPELKTGSVIFFNRTGMTDERYLNKIDGIYIKKLKAAGYTGSDFPVSNL